MFIVIKLDVRTQKSVIVDIDNDDLIAINSMLRAVTSELEKDKAAVAVHVNREEIRIFSKDPGWIRDGKELRYVFQILPDTRDVAGDNTE